MNKLKKFPGKTAILRVDFNVDSSTGSGHEAFKLEASLPTLKLLAKKCEKLVILSHRGRPEGVNYEVRSKNYDALSLREFRPFLEKSLKEKVIFLEKIPSSLPNGKIFLLENLRFWPEEEKNDASFAKDLARLGDFYVNDAFAASHRENASVTQLPKLLPSCVGLLLEKEIVTLTAAMKNPEKPLVLILGGSKIEDKAPVIKNLLSKAEKVLLGSSALNAPELGIRNYELGKIILPIDQISEGRMGFDIGPKTIQLYKKEIKTAKTIIWNGPLGKFEDEKYAGGSIAIAKAIAASEAFSIIGGGETTMLFTRVISNFKFKISKKRIFLSTGGGAMLELLAGKKLPGIEALK